MRTTVQGHPTARHSVNFERSVARSGDPSPKPVLWLFESRGRRPPQRRFRLYLLISLVGSMGFLSLLLLGNVFPHQATLFRAAALIWFLVLGAFRIRMFWRR